MGIHRESKNKKREIPLAMVRFCDPRDDRVGGLEENDEDDFEKPSPSANKKIPQSEAKGKK